MFGGGFVQGLGQFGLPLGGGRLPPPRAVSSSADGADPELLRSETARPSGQKGKFPLKAALTSGSLLLAGDTAAQFYGRYQKSKSGLQTEKPVWKDEDFWRHDWARALRLGGFGFTVYGPAAQNWYMLLEHFMPVKSAQTFLTKVALNNLVLGPFLIASAFTWNAGWQGQLERLPTIISRQAPVAMVDGLKFWIPVTFVNFGIVPLEARVAFMSSCSVCWSFYLSILVSKKV